MWGGFRGESPRYATPALLDGAFHFCRLQYYSDRREAGGTGWWTDYPGADINFSIRFSELTRAAVGRDRDDEPEHFVVRSSGDDALFQCPFVTMEDAGTAALSSTDVLQFRKYLLKGGFIWNDDFWGSAAWDNWVSQVSRVLSPAQYPIVEIPPTHAMFHTQFNVDPVPQVPAIQSWRRMGKQTSERGEDSAVVHTRGIFDEKGRLMVLMTHNNRHLGYLGTRRRGYGVLLPVLSGRLRDGGRCHAVRDEPLSAPGAFPRRSVQRGGGAT